VRIFLRCFRFYFPNRFLKRETLPRDFGIGQWRIHRPQLIQQRLPRAVIDSPPCLARIWI
jgi:hypothetical protein